MFFIRQRHAQLFELLRQQNVSDQARTRAGARPIAELSGTEVEKLQAVAVRSWR